MNHTYKIAGMTCDNCAATVRDKLLRLPEITSVDVDRQKQEAEIVMQHHVPLSSLQQALSGTKYSITEENNSMHHTAADEQENQSTLKTYLPVFLIFGYITVVTLLIQY